MTTEPTDQTTRYAVDEVLVRYATAIDTRNWDLLRTCFTPDVVADYGDLGSWTDVEGIVEWMRVVHEPCGHTLHRISNVAVSLDGPGRVRATAYIDAIVRGTDGTTGVHAVGSYDDRLVETDGGWRIARRTFTSVLMEPIAGAARPSSDTA